MRYYEKVQKTVEQSNLKGIQCNRCEEIFEPYDELIQPFDLPLHNEYGQINFDLCNKCLLEIIKELKIVPNGFKSDSGFTSSFDLDHELHQQLFDEWKETGIWNNDENPYRDAWMCGMANIEKEEELFDELENIETRKPLYSNGLKIVK
jgi:hypothetical protein